MNKQINENKLKQEMKKNNKTLLDKIIALFKNENFERSLVPELGFQIEWSEVGQPVNKVVVDEEGNETTEPVGKGEFITDAGTVVVDDSSLLVEVRETPAEPEMPEEEPEEELQLPVDEEAPIEEAPATPEIVEVPVEDLPNGEVIKSQIEDSISSLVGNVDGEYYIKVIVENGQISEANMSSETDLLKKKCNDLEMANQDLKKKLEEPIGEPILEPEVPKKEWSKMSAYERAIYRAKQE